MTTCFRSICELRKACEKKVRSINLKPLWKLAQHHRDNESRRASLKELPPLELRIYILETLEQLDAVRRSMQGVTSPQKMRELGMREGWLEGAIAHRRVTTLLKALELSTLTEQPETTSHIKYHPANPMPQTPRPEKPLPPLPLPSEINSEIDSDPSIPGPTSFPLRNSKFGVRKSKRQSIISVPQMDASTVPPRVMVNTKDREDSPNKPARHTSRSTGSIHLPTPNHTSRPVFSLPSECPPVYAAFPITDGPTREQVPFPVGGVDDHPSGHIPGTSYPLASRYRPLAPIYVRDTNQVDMVEAQDQMSAPPDQHPNKGSAFTFGEPEDPASTPRGAVRNDDKLILSPLSMASPLGPELQDLPRL
ncbi:hypothetical protein C8R43DRAFT_1238192 [Mycena crocata]|nr:hypothetical protein C8R43DRAFT_1238192 [Mycena crocata]